ncbi:MAG: TrbI/VirB10 family protein [Proteobacteria bacterium]|nr:TrbI/VirB10 family protein [Pseudomonadota bacterium]
MKSRFEKNEDYDPDQDSEVDAGGPGVASAKGSKTLIIVASALLITVVLYFFFFKTEEVAPVENLEEVATDRKNLAPAAPTAIEDFGDDFLEESQDDILSQPSTPQLPALPELSEEDSEFVGLLPTFLESESVPQEEGTTQTPPPPPIAQQTTQTPPTPPIFQEPQPTIPQAPTIPQNQNQTTQQAAPEVVLDPRKAPIIVLSSGSRASPALNVGFENNIIRLNEEAIDQLAASQSTIVPTLIADRTVVINQGKMLTAVLETAINTELPGSVRAIVSRDVYAESGNNILIPKGSRLFGAYTSTIVRGQGRIQIGWTRLIRPDGVDLNISFEAADQFGRAGLEGDIDNRYGSIIANSLLTSILTVGAAVATEKLAGLDDTTTTTNADGSVTTSGSAASSVLQDVSGSIVDTVQEVLNNTLNTSPIIRVPQGTRITIIVNSDMTLPPQRLTR